MVTKNNLSHSYLLIRIDKQPDGGRKNFYNIKSVMELSNLKYQVIFENYKSMTSYIKLIISIVLFSGNRFIVNQAFLCLCVYVSTIFQAKKIIYIIDSIDNNYPKGFKNKIKGVVVVCINKFLSQRKNIYFISETNYLKEKFKSCNKSFVINTPYPDAINILPLRKASFRSNSIIRLLYVGRLSEEKGVLNLIDFIKRSKNKNYCISIIGDGDFRDQIQLLCVKNKNVTYHGWMENEDILKLYYENDILIHFPNKDAYPTVFREAFSNALPIVSLEIQGIPEIITTGKDGELLPYYSYALVEEKVDKIAKDLKFYSENALCKSAKNNFQIYCKNLLSVFKMIN